MGFLALRAALPMPELVDQSVRVIVLGATLLWIARPVIDLRVRYLVASLGIGIFVFVIWIAPDIMAPNYRHHWLFENSLTGAARGTLSTGGRGNPLVLVLRAFRAVVIVPIIEELFWRAWLMRWIISHQFQEIPLGAYAPVSFWAVAILFASEHGSYWDVGLVTGIIYNCWMIRSKSLGDLILTHAVTNACLSFYVIAAGKWEYWL